MKRFVLFILIIIFIIIISAIVKQVIIKNSKNSDDKNIPQVELNDIYGQRIQLSNICDELPIILLYFNTECEFCESVIEDLLLHKTMLSDVCIIFVSQESINTLKEYMGKHPINTFPHCMILSDDRFDLTEELGILAPPMWFVYDTNGHLVKSSQGIITAKSIKKILNEKN